MSALDGALFLEKNCLFGGGTAIALQHGEYRESVDIDFLVSEVDSYRALRELLTGAVGITSIFRHGAASLIQAREPRTDQYGIRTVLLIADQPIKFEIVLEGRIDLEVPNRTDRVCGIATLAPLDMATSKLLANSDCWADEGVFSRDVIDLGMMSPSIGLLRAAVAKAERAYGDSIVRDLDRALHALQNRQGWLERCIQALAIGLPKAVVWKHLRALRRVLP